MTNFAQLLNKYCQIDENFEKKIITTFNLLDSNPGLAMHILQKEDFSASDYSASAKPSLVVPMPDKAN